MKRLMALSACFILGSNAMALAQNNGESKVPEAGKLSKNIPGATKEKPFVNSLGMKFVPVSGTKVFFSVWDVRVQDYRAYAKANTGTDATWGNPVMIYGNRVQPLKQGEDHPVVNVNWEDAKNFCKWLTGKERGEGKIGAKDKYRLPTDHEWSCAVGIGDQEDADATPESKGGKIKEVYPWGIQWPPPKGCGNYDPIAGVDDFDGTSPVGSFGANDAGLYDMGGNVSQWCEDLYSPASELRVIRGTNWSDGNNPALLLSSDRIVGDSSDRDVHTGFRCVLVTESAGSGK